MFAHRLSATAELRSLEVWHVAEFAAHMDRARDHIRPWVGSSFVTQGLEGAAATLTRYADRAARDGARIFGIWDDGVLIGGVMFVEFHASAGVAEIGCWLEPDAEGRGVITTACEALLEWAFLVRGINRVEWRCRTDNVRSSHVAERLGMTLEGVLRGAWKVDEAFHDKQVWSILRHEFTDTRP
jgi:ribosomal-protein-serine acetyltransferase